MYTKIYKHIGMDVKSCLKQYQSCLKPAKVFPFRYKLHKYCSWKIVSLVLLIATLYIQIQILYNSYSYLYKTYISIDLQYKLIWFFPLDYIWSCSCYNTTNYSNSIIKSTVNSHKNFRFQNIV
jgi:hypothetical protein